MAADRQSSDRSNSKSASAAIGSGNRPSNPEGAGPSFLAENLPKIEKELADAIATSSKKVLNLDKKGWEKAIVDKLLESGLSESEIDPALLDQATSAVVEITQIRDRLIDGQIAPKLAFEKFRDAIEKVRIGTGTFQGDFTPQVIALATAENEEEGGKIGGEILFNSYVADAIYPIDEFDIGAVSIEEICERLRRRLKGESSDGDFGAKVVLTALGVWDTLSPEAKELTLKVPDDQIVMRSNATPITETPEFQDLPKTASEYLEKYTEQLSDPDMRAALVEAAGVAAYDGSDNLSKNYVKS